MASSCYGQSDTAKELYEKGVRENLSGQLIEASVTLTKAISEEPGYAAAYYQRGMSFYGIEKTNSAINDLERATRFNVSSINAYLTLIDIYKKQKAYKKAIIVTDRIANQLPDNAIGAYYTQGLIYEELNDFPNALKSYRKADDLAFQTMPKFARKLQKRIAEVQSMKTLR